MGLGIALVLVATVAFGLGDVLARKALYTTAPGLVVVATAATVAVTLAVLVVSLEGVAVLTSQTAAFYGFTALMGFLASVTGQTLYFHGLHRVGITLAAPMLGAAPLFAIVLAVVIAGERPGIATVAGAVVIVLGVVVLVSERDRVVS